MENADVCPPPPVKVLPAPQLTDANPFAPGATETNAPKTWDAVPAGTGLAV
ncbi:MAG: hypothetical protein M3Q30_24150 [Actinomycetota bacterium]|nr:hypothetical protein [Actinomycetota bacterium]